MKRIFIYSTVLMLALSYFAISAKAQGNPANPYDETGALHNAVLARFFTDYSKERVVKEKMDEQGLCQYVCKVIPVSNCGVAYAISNDATVQVLRSMAPVEMAHYLQDKGFVSGSFTAYVEKINGCIGQQAGTSYAVLHSAISNVESLVLADAGLKAEERKLLLLTSSIARYSAKFWMDLNEGQTTYAGLGQAAVSIAKDTINEIIRFDLAGTLIGGYLSFWTWDLEIFVKTTAMSAAVFSVVAGVAKIWNWLIH